MASLAASTLEALVFHELQYGLRAALSLRQTLSTPASPSWKLGFTTHVWSSDGPPRSAEATSVVPSAR